MVVYIHRRKSDKKPFYIGVSKNLKRPYDFNARTPYWKRVKQMHGVIVEIYAVDIEKWAAYKTEGYLILKYCDTVININGNVTTKYNKYVL